MVIKKRPDLKILYLEILYFNNSYQVKVPWFHVHDASDLVGARGMFEHEFFRVRKTNDTVNVPDCK